MKNEQKIQLQRGAAYIRESTEEQDKGFSPDNQRRAIEEYAKHHNIKIVEWYKDLVSGTKASKRDDFQRMITDAMQKKFKVILVFHTSRFARNVQEARQYKELLRKKQGIDVIFVTQQFGNHEDPSSFLNEGVNELFDEYYSKQLSFWVRSNLMEKRRQGRQNGNPPLGYHKKKLGYDKERSRTIYAKDWLVQPEEAKLVKRMYQSYAAGKYSYADLAAEANKWGVKTKYGHPFTYSSIKGILCNKVYLGYVYSPRRGYPIQKGLHKAIIPQELFEKVQATIERRTNTHGRPIAQHRFYLLQDLVYCYKSMKHLKGKENNPTARLLPKMYCEAYQWRDAKGVKQERLRYGCKFKRENKSCNQPDVETKIIDNQVIAFMEGFQLPDDVIDMTLDKLKKLLAGARKTNVQEDVIQRLQKKKQKLSFLYTNTDELTEESYMSRLTELNTELKKYTGTDSVKPALSEKKYLEKAEHFLKDFKKLWRSDIGDQERRAWIQQTIKRVWVKDKRVVAIEPHDDFKPLFVTHRKVIGQLPLAAPTVTATLRMSRSAQSSDLSPEVLTKGETSVKGGRAAERAVLHLIFAMK